MIRYEDWRNSERIIVLDGDQLPSSITAKVVKYERDGKPFNFKLAWDIGIRAANNANLLLVDSDRLLDKSFINAAKEITDYQICYPRHILNLKETINDIESFNPNIKLKTQHISHRYTRQSSRNPASGNMSLTKQTYNQINRQVDEQQLSWGYTDADFIETARRAKISFLPINSRSIHLKHDYSLPSEVFTALKLKNALSHYKKFNLPLPRHIRDYVMTKDLDLDLIESMTFDEVIAGKLHEGAKRKSI